MATLPSGMLTFLMTDVEASTRRWEREPDAMRQAMARHDELFESSIERFRGINIKPRGEGDSRFAVFSRATDAVCAAAEIQHDFCNTTWPTASPVRIRMAIHTGEADLIDGDYYGSTVNRCARLRSLAHGGQTLVSLVTAQHVRESLPESVRLRDLGKHRLKDLSMAEHVFQLDVDGAETSFPPLQSLDRHPTNLPAQATSLVGREQEAGTVREWLLEPQTRLVTLTGPGGTGKTRLGLHIAANLVDEFIDGVFLVPLEAVVDSELIAQSIAQAVGVRESGETSLADDVSEYLSDKTMLLLFDNFDQLVDGARQLSDLLSVAPNLKILVTSRVLLSVRGEREFPVPPLGLPPSERMPPLERLMDYDAVRLFVTRARDVKSDFTLTEENAPAVVAICWKLDGLPLAIELAAARVRLFSPAALLKRLERRLPLLTGGARDLPQRQQALRDTIAWSYDLLVEPEQQLFRRMAVFNGGFTIAAAIAVSDSDEADTSDPLGGFDDFMLDPIPDDQFGGWDPVSDTVEGLEALVSKSLLRREQSLDPNDADPRFSLLQTIREFGLEQLNAAGELADVRDRHARHYLQVAELARPELSGPNQGSCIQQLEREHGNLRAAMAYALQTSDADLGLRLAGALWQFWELNSYPTEGRNWIDRMLTLEGQPEYRADALSGAGTMAWILGDHTAAAEYHSQALELYRKIGDENQIAFATTNLGAQHLGQYDFEQAEALFNEALDGYQRAGNELGMADALNNLAIVAYLQGDMPAASERFEDALRYAQKQGDQQRVADALFNLGDVAYEQGSDACALEYYQRSLFARRQLGVRAGVAQSFAAIATILARDGQPEPAARLLGAADGLIDETGVSLESKENDRYTHTAAQLRSVLEGGRFMSLREEGRNLTLAETMESALASRISNRDEGDSEPPSELATYSILE